MSLTVDGFWKAGFWSTTFWADGFWFEGGLVQEQNSGGYFPNTRRRTKEELKQERIALGILPPEALEAVDLAVQSTAALARAQPETQAATDALLDKQRAQDLFIKAYLAVYPMLEEAAILQQMNALIQEREFIIFLSAL